ncbi:MAG: glycosyltransferase family 4 protein [Gammaproteobacteria bacterium]|nr:glycosyltransferase family 4 protein [Gammaproteobacteria bacterium]MDH5650745.1 glycosyltransferase family 4 protein [Gammaproteobacteria bacterium]
MMMKNTKPSICFVAHNAYGALAGEDTGHIGGIERQQAMMAKWLAAHGYKVSMVTWEEEGGNPALVNGVRVYTMCKRTDGVRFVKFFYPRWSSLNRAMAQADADIYYYNCGELGLGQVVMWAKRHGKKSMYTVASEIDCNFNIKNKDVLRERLLYHYGVRHADDIVVQTNAQKKLLAETYQRESTLIPMPSTGFGLSEAWLDEKIQAAPSPRVIWVGRFSNEKRLEWLLGAAENLPEVRFDILGAANFNTDYARKLNVWANRLKNVKVHGRVQHDRIGAFYKNATLLCCTSLYEGFPNVFLEAWSTGLPVITTFDPDNIVQNYKLGEFVMSTEALELAIRKMITDRNKYESAARNAWHYFHNHHTLDHGMALFEKQFARLMAAT